MNATLKHYLTKLEALVDPDQLAEARAGCERAFAFEPLKELPYILTGELEAPDRDWPSYPYNDAFFEPPKMLLNELHGPFLHLQARDYQPLNIRCNYGTPILPSVFGAGYRLMEKSLPWTHHLGGRPEIERLVARGVPDLEQGLGGKCLSTLGFYQQTLADYPKLSRAVCIYHPDLQGPFDVAHLIWGPDILVGLYDCPELVHALLALVTDTYARWMRLWKTLTVEGNTFTTHWSFHIRGGIMLRNDTPVMLSARHYEEFVKPYDQRLLDEFGGCIHFCGRGAAFIASMCQSRNLFGINCSQPELNDMALHLRSVRDNRLVLLGLDERYVPAHVTTGAIVYRNQRSAPPAR